MARDLTVADLRAMLDEYPDTTPVRLALQPSYPLQAHISRQVGIQRDPEGELVRVYLLEEGQVYDAPYASRELWGEGTWVEEDGK